MWCWFKAVQERIRPASVVPFLDFEGKWAIVLALTSNVGGFDFQTKELKSGQAMYEKVLETSSSWGTADNMMYVVGATKPEYFDSIRKVVPDHFLLVPGVGAQGGDLEGVCKFGLNDECGLLINSSRGIIYASPDEDFAAHAKNEAKKLQYEMQLILEKFKILV